MRVLVDIGQTEIAALERLARKREAARAVLIREAISDYLARHHGSGQGDAFGLWEGRAMDALAYQEKLRSEW